MYHHCDQGEALIGHKSTLLPVKHNITVKSKLATVKHIHNGILTMDNKMVRPQQPTQADECSTEEVH